MSQFKFINNNLENNKLRQLKPPQYIATKSRQYIATKSRQYIATKPQSKLKENFKCLTVLLFHNDEDLVESQVKYYKKNNQDIIIFNHCSTDDTTSIINSLKSNILCVYNLSKEVNFFNNEVHSIIYEILNGEHNLNEKKDLVDLSEIKYNQFNYSSNYDWISFPESDEFLEGPDRKLSYYQYLRIVDTYKNINKITFKNFVYWFTDKDNPDIKDPCERIKYYSIKKKCAIRLYAWRGKFTQIRWFGHQDESDKIDEIVDWNTRHYEMRSLTKFHNKVKDRVKAKNEEEEVVGNCHYDLMYQQIISNTNYGIIVSSELYFDDGYSDLIETEKYDWYQIYDDNSCDNYLKQQLKINYVIATYNGKCKRKNENPTPNNILQLHIKYLLKYKKNISQITIMKAKSDNYYKDYYNLSDIIDKSDIPIKIIDCENYAYSPGQWLYAYELYKNEFDYYFFVEDDYCGNFYGFDEIFLNCYKDSCINNIGLLSSIVEDSIGEKKAPLHFEGCVLVSMNTLNELYSNPFYNKYTPRQCLNLINNKIDFSFDWDQLKKAYAGAYYQVTFSTIFTKINIKHYSLLKINNNQYPFCYWSDKDNKLYSIIFDYNINDNKYNPIKNDIVVIHNCPIVPIQAINKELFDNNT